MSLILCSSPKGGVGVTTVAAAIARHFAGRGQEVIAVDLSGQGALAYHLRDGEDDGEAAARPAGIAHGEAPAGTARGADRAEFALARRRDEAIVIVDIAAGDEETMRALAPHARLTLCVLAADAGSVITLPRIFAGRQPPHAVLNLIDDRRPLGADASAFLTRAFGPRLLAAIRRDEAVNEALGRMGPIASGSAAARDLTVLGERLEDLLAAAAPASAPTMQDVA